MMKPSSAAFLALLSLSLGGAGAFAPRPASTSTISSTISSTTSTISTSTTSLGGVTLPRVDLPVPVTSKLDGFGLKNPNSLTDEEYRAYSGAAILGTVLFLLPGALLCGIPGALGDLASGAASDFVLSALAGGGLAIYLALQAGEAGTAARDLGGTFLDVTGLPVPRYDLPSSVTQVIEGRLGLLSPNALDDADYTGYSGAAVAGTLLFFLLPGAALTGELGYLGELGTALVTDFVLAALVGGGLAIYLSLRDDDVAGTVNSAGIGLLDAVDGVLLRADRLLAENSSASSTISSAATAAAAGEPKEPKEEEEAIL